MLLDSEQIELDCSSTEPGERDARYFVRLRYGEVEMITPRQLATSRGYKPVCPASDDLKLLATAIELAERHANKPGLETHVRTLRHSSSDMLKAMRRVLLNAEAGPNYSGHDLELRAVGPDVMVVAKVSRK